MIFHHNAICAEAQITFSHSVPMDAENGETDLWARNGGYMTENIEVFTQNSIRITDKDRRIYIDPFQMKISPHDADLILITHDHHDHFSPEDSEKVAGNGTVLIVPQKMKDKAGEAAAFVKKTLTVEPGNSYEMEGLSFETVASYNKVKPFHMKSAGWVGYILCIDGKRIYIAGDTDDTDEAEKVKCDIALVPIGGTYTMDAKQAAKLINTIRPVVAIPVHYGSIVGNKEDGDDFARQVDDQVKVEFKIQF